MGDSTQASTFADSAIDMPTNPRPTKSTMQPADAASAKQSLSERLERFTAAILGQEQNNTISEARSDALNNMLDNFEKRFE